MTIRVVYRGGAFVPQGTCDLQEGTQGSVLVEPSPFEMEPVTDPAERRRILNEVIESMKANPLPADSPKLTREQMHERS